ncbi:NADPH-dependent ferric siderophore reductase [Rhodoferax lacus]|uniref:NADPH-dependent ferric siderophore reductase n=1 Tax=Rhodoferax lacus TaxID=2184758 RepID=A0A3E1REH3_9BURK|nr:siderophore-interacting protein [Rhodoferax lacus]RFO97432.1 NADPH-dependent ferric siderophore reductase [Rhodoferax lacus]
MNFFSSNRRVQRVRHELLAREVRVSHIQRISPGFLAITFAGESLSSFVSLSFDDHVKLMLTDAHGTMHRRDFTPVRFDLHKRELTLEFALHASGVACEWARQAQIGDRAVIGGPRGSMVVPVDYAWHLLAGDATALPAIQRRLEELPAGVRALVLVQVPQPEDQRDFQSRADLHVQWLATPEALVQAIEQVQLPSGEGFVWCAGESSSMARVRKTLLGARQVPRESARISAYWKAGAADYHEAREH